MPNRLKDTMKIDTSDLPSELYTLGVVVVLLSWAVLYMSFLSGILLWMTAWLLFIAFEDNCIHSAQEHENRFASLMGMYLAFIVLFTEDSPLGFIGQKFPRIGLLCVFVFGFFVTIWTRSNHRHTLAAPIRIAGSLRKASSHVGLVDRNRISQVVDEVIVAVRTLDRNWMPSSPDAIKWLNSSMEMGAVQRALENTNAPELNEVLLRLAAYHPPRDYDDQEDAQDEAKNFISLAIYKVKDGWSHGSRTRLLKFFCEDRLSDLNTRSRVLLLHALQQLRISASPKAAFYVRQILTTSTFGELIRLKLEMDSKGDYHSLHKLIFVDLNDDEERAIILKHMEKEAKSFLSLMRLGGRLGQKMLNARPWRKILSDIDDTLKCSAGHYPAGCDLSLPRKALYPGVLALYREIDLGVTEAQQWERSVSEVWPTTEFSYLRRDVGNLVFLSARPHVYKDWSEASQYKHFIELHGSLNDGESMHAIPTLLPGDLSSGAEFMRNQEFTPLAIKKFNSFKQFASLWPEFRHVFIGDNGQGDVRAAELMMGLGSTAPTEFKVEVSYIHRVRRTELTFGEGDPVSWREHGIIFVDNFVDAAVHAALTHKFNRVETTATGRKVSPLTTRMDGRRVALITPLGLHRICTGAAYDFLTFDDRNQLRSWKKMGSIGPWAREAYRQRLQHSLNIACITLAELRHKVKRIELVSRCQFAPGCRVSIRRSPGARALSHAAPLPAIPPIFGGLGCDGIVRSFRASDGMYKVELLGWRLSKDRPVYIYVSLFQLSPVGLPIDDELMVPKRGQDPSKTKKVQTRRFGFKAGSSPHYIIEIGCLVRTPMGKAKVIEIKKVDKQKIVVVVYDWWNSFQPISDNTNTQDITSSSSSSSSFSSPKGYIRIEDVSLISSPPPLPPLPPRVSSTRQALRGGTKLIKRLLGSSFNAEVSKTSPACLFDDGCAVVTAFGNGTVKRFRSEDNIYEVLLHWGSYAFLPPSSITLRCAFPVNTLVMTAMGIPGELIEVRPRTGIHVVAVPARAFVHQKKSFPKKSPRNSPESASSPEPTSPLTPLSLPPSPSIKPKRLSSLPSLDPALPSLEIDFSTPESSSTFHSPKSFDLESSPTGVRAAGRVARRRRPRALSLGAAAEIEQESEEEEPLVAGELAGYDNKQRNTSTEAVDREPTTPPTPATPFPRRFFLPAALSAPWPLRGQNTTSAIDPKTIPHPCLAMQMYFQPDNIISCVKALPGQIVQCHLGGASSSSSSSGRGIEGVVISVRKNNIYEVALTGWRLGDKVATAILREDCITSNSQVRTSSWWAGVKFW